MPEALEVAYDALQRAEEAQESALVANTTVEKLERLISELRDDTLVSVTVLRKALRSYADGAIIGPHSAREGLITELTN